LTVRANLGEDNTAKFGEGEKERERERREGERERERGREREREKGGREERGGPTAGVI